MTLIETYGLSPVLADGSMRRGKLLFVCSSLPRQWLQPIQPGFGANRDSAHGSKSAIAGANGGGALGADGKRRLVFPHPIRSSRRIGFKSR